MKQANQSLQQSAAVPSQPAASTNPSANPEVICLSLAIALPVLLVLSLVAHKRYRFARRQQRVDHLEKLWLLNCEETKS